MNDEKRMINKKIIQQEMNRISKYISTDEKKVLDEKKVVHEMYVIQQIGVEDLKNIGPIIERNFKFDTIVKDLKEKKQVEHLIECDRKTSRCMECIKKVIGSEENEKEHEILEDFLFKY